MRRVFQVILFLMLAFQLKGQDSASVFILKTDISWLAVGAVSNNYLWLPLEVEITGRRMNNFSFTIYTGFANRKFITPDSNSGKTSEGYIGAGGRYFIYNPSKRKRVADGFFIDLAFIAYRSQSEFQFQAEPNTIREFGSKLHLKIGFTGTFMKYITWTPYVGYGHQPTFGQLSKRFVPGFQLGWRVGK